MERISVTAAFCVALIIGIILQAPPQVYKNISAYYESLGKRPAPAQVTNTAPPSKATRSRKPARTRMDSLRTASFEPFGPKDEQKDPPSGGGLKDSAVSRN
jgi:hypothetical protein